MFSTISVPIIITTSLILVTLYIFENFWQLLICFTGIFLIYCLAFVIMFSLQYPDRYIEIVKMVMNFMSVIFEINYDYEEDQSSNHQIVISDCKQYYTYKGVHYDIAFPLFWALFETPQRGPHQCLNCLEYGSFRGVFIMYCSNCAKEYNDNCEYVGYGTINNGVELVGNDINKCAWKTYLAYRQPNCIGLPEEKEKAELNRDGYEYVICEVVNENGVITHLYPDFKEIDQEYSDDYDDDDDDDDYDDYDDDEYYSDIDTEVADYNR